MEAVVFGNVTLDILCQTVDEVPRHESIAFENVAVSPGGCGSNVAIGLSALGVATTIVARIGSDDAAGLVESYWDRVGLDHRYVERVPGRATGTSVGLIDSDAQPRFIHTSGANATLTADCLKVADLVALGARALHIGGYFVLPGLQNEALAAILEEARQLGVTTSLDVVRSPRIDEPSSLWSCLPHVDLFMCNAHEAWRLTGEREPSKSAVSLRSRGAQSVVVKLGAAGCWLANGKTSERIPAPIVNVVDTTGAGDAFAAGMIASLLRENNIKTACKAGNEAGSHAVRVLGALGAWFPA